MQFIYQAAAILLAGVCIGLAIQTLYLGLDGRREGSGRTVAWLAVFHAMYCLGTVGFISAPTAASAHAPALFVGIGAAAMPVLMADLVIRLGSPKPWLRLARTTALWLAVGSTAATTASAFWSMPLAFSSIVTIPDNVNRYRPTFTPGYLVIMGLCAALLTAIVVEFIRLGLRNRELRPVSIGCGILTATYALDALQVVGVLDAYFLQPIGFSAVVVGSWVLLARRHQRDADKLVRALTRLEEHRIRLLTDAPRIQKQKLESIGTLAAGVAHEINNPLQSIMNYATLLGRRLTEGDETKAYAEEIVGEASRAAKIVRDLLVFARMDSAERTIEDARTLVEETVSMIRPSLERREVAVSVDVPAEPLSVVCSRRHIQQVLLNLLSNACDALDERFPKGDRRKLVAVRAHGGERGEIVISVEDQGGGIANELRERVFEPFFTTKKDLQGTGLGLSISHGIVSSHGGQLEVSSEPGRYTRFDVKLPSSAAPATSTVSGVQ